MSASSDQPACYRVSHVCNSWKTLVAAALGTNRIGPKVKYRTYVTTSVHFLFMIENSIRVTFVNQDLELSGMKSIARNKSHVRC